MKKKFGVSGGLGEGKFCQTSLCICVGWEEGRKKIIKQTKVAMGRVVVAFRRG